MLKVHKKNDIRTKYEIDKKVNLYSRCIGCDFKRFVTIDEEKIKNANNK